MAIERFVLAGGRAAATRWAVLLALLTAPIVGHGCHREDIDDEPAFVLPQREAQPQPQ